MAPGSNLGGQNSRTGGKKRGGGAQPRSFVGKDPLGAAGGGGEEGGGEKKTTLTPFKGGREPPPCWGEKGPLKKKGRQGWRTPQQPRRNSSRGGAPT